MASNFCILESMTSDRDILEGFTNYCILTSITLAKKNGREVLLYIIAQNTVPGKKKDVPLLVNLTDD